MSLERRARCEFFLGQTLSLHLKLVNAKEHWKGYLPFSRRGGEEYGFSYDLIVLVLLSPPVYRV